ncbi:hypothetical protein P5P81_05270 [Tritonibacter mobilis]|nr:hypothetical protein [Tritonibacter mobilis]
MMLGRRTEMWIALTLLLLALVSLFVWIPLDSETPAIYEFRRNVNIGDAMLPMVAAAGLAICAAIHLIAQLRRQPDSFEDPPLTPCRVCLPCRCWRSSLLRFC